MACLTAFYDLAVSPASYDFATFLAIADIARQANEIERLHVVIVPAPTHTGFRIDHKPNTTENKIWRRDHLLVPLCRLVGATHTVCATRDGAQMYMTAAEHVWPPQYKLTAPAALYMMGHYRSIAQQAGVKASFRASEQARDWVNQWRVPGKDYITLTMRETYTDARNSNRPAWDEFRKYATYKGYWVVTIPDTERAGRGEPLGGIAAINPDVRLALYEGAAMNLGVNNGPLSLCWYTDCPHLTFKMVTPGWPSTEQSFFERQGFPVGSQYPLSRADQKLIWQDDTFENIRNAFDAWAETLDGHKHVQRAS